MEKTIDCISILTLLPTTGIYPSPIESHACLCIESDPQGALKLRKIIPSLCHHLENKLFENFLLLSVSFVLRETGLSERGGKMDKRSQ